MLESAVRFSDISAKILSLTYFIQRSSTFISYQDGIIPGQNTPIVNDLVNTFEGEFMSFEEPVVQPSKPLDPARHFDVMSFLILAAKVVCFLPWCIAVGATLSLAPQYLELVTFQTGYVPSIRGVRRFAYWA